MSTPMTKAEGRRLLVSQFDAEGLDAEEIAHRIGVSVDEVDRILDQLDGVPHQETVRTADIHGTERGFQLHKANGEKPCNGCQQAHVTRTAAHVAAATRAVRKAAPADGDVTPTPEPEPIKSSPEPVKDVSEPVKPAERPAAEVQAAPAIQTFGKGVGTARPRRARKPVVHGTYAGYNRHAGDGEKPCEACSEARRKYQRDLNARKKAEADPSAEEPAAPAPTSFEEFLKPRPAVVPPPQKPMVVVQRQQVQVRWLIPRGEELPEAVHHVDYGLVDERGRIVPCSEATAEQSADMGMRVYRRLVTAWVVVSE